MDNRLYPKSAKLHDMMAEKIQQHITKHLEISDEARTPYDEYYRSYGDVLEGLIRHHKISESRRRVG